MEILSLDCVDSTQKYLIESIKKGKLNPPIALISKTQTDGVGSRGNEWIGHEKDLFMSIATPKSSMPSDLPLHSSSIYFGVMVIEILRAFSSSAYLKWPNDIYIKDKKIGGVITSTLKDCIVYGVGINKQSTSNNFGVLDIEVDNITITQKLIKMIEKKRTWKEIFRFFEVEFHKSKNYTFNHFDSRFNLKDAKLNSDGSVEIEGVNYYSLR